MEDWQKPHEQIISQFLHTLNKRSGAYVLKGGTALKQCYGLDRFSEDIDLDAVKGNLKETLNKFCAEHDYSYTIKKDTDTVKRYMLNYGGEKNLKIEVSYRRRNISDAECSFINEIKVYKLDTLTLMKANAYMSRDKIRDLYDLTFICNNYFDKLSGTTKSMLQNAIEYKGIEQFDYITATQKDPLINNDELAEKFLQMYERLGLLMNEKERQIVERSQERKGQESDDKIITPSRNVHPKQIYNDYLARSGGIFRGAETDREIYLQMVKDGYERRRIATILQESQSFINCKNARTEAMQAALNFEKLPEVIKLRKHSVER